ncbi:putative ATP-grasp target RiPP [Microtetraspora malaysiensis]|uniref:putative ATP-grasp target RiPP n=1 Tax=Microtetraspora malaysiensis TaxID=161358 RepID=UPI003D8DDBCB
MSKIKLDDLALDGAELSEGDLGLVGGGRMPEMKVTWYIGGKPAEWDIVNG